MAGYYHCNSSLSPSSLWPYHLLLVCLSLCVSTLASQHRLIGEACGPDVGTCSSNQALHCDADKQVCVCPDGSEWVQEHTTQPHLCRIVPGGKCTRLDNIGPQCMGNYHCVADIEPGAAVEGSEVMTICKCGTDHDCEKLDMKHSDGSVHSDGPYGRGANHGSAATSINHAHYKQYLLLILLIF